MQTAVIPFGSQRVLHGDITAHTTPSSKGHHVHYTVSLLYSFFLRHGRCSKSFIGIIVVFANHGVAHTLTTNLNGKSAFVTA